jgi:hypothetical protein
MSEMSLSSKITYLHSYFGKTLGLVYSDIEPYDRDSKNRSTYFKKGGIFGQYLYHCRYAVKGFTLPEKPEEKVAAKERKYPLMCVSSNDGFYDLYAKKSYETLEEWLADVNAHKTSDKKDDATMNDIYLWLSNKDITIPLTILEKGIDSVLESMDMRPDVEFDSLDSIITEVCKHCKERSGGRYELTLRSKMKMIVHNPVTDGMTTHDLQKASTFTQRHNFRPYNKDEGSSDNPLYKYSFNYVVTGIEGHTEIICVKKMSDFPHGITMKHVYLQVYDKALFTNVYHSLYALLHDLPKETMLKSSK